MKKLKYEILFTILFMTIGIAAVTSNLVINGTTPIASNPDDFNVYFSGINEVSGSVENNVTILGERKLSFSADLQAIGDKVAYNIDVTNSSKNYDAEIFISCSFNEKYIHFRHMLDSQTIPARQTANLYIDLALYKSYSGDEDLIEEITCTLDAFAIERTTQGSGNVATPVNPYYLGQEIAIGEEKFNVIGWDTETVTMLAKYVIDDTHKQNSTEYYSSDRINMFSPGGWPAGIGDFDINIYSTEVALYVNNYVDYLKEITGEEDISGNLITLMQLKDLGCSIDETYMTENMYCNESPYKDIIFNTQRWSTRSANGKYNNDYFVVAGTDFITVTDLYADGFVRPTITVSKKIAEQLINVYPVGKEISIGTEKFNVISDNGTTVTTLAQYNIKKSSPFLQTNNQNNIEFANNGNWIYTPGPKEIEITTKGEKGIVINNYVTYLKNTYNINTSANLISVNELGKLGCNISSNYALGEGGWNCNNSKYSSWLINEQNWWTRSANSNHSEKVWVVHSDGILNTSDCYDEYGIRPTITISKEDLENYN